jgi:hypothetical protein
VHFSTLFAPGKSWDNVRSTTAPYTESRLTRSVANERVGFPVVEQILYTRDILRESCTRPRCGTGAGGGRATQAGKAFFASNFSLRFDLVIFASKRNKAKRNSSLFFRYFRFFSLFSLFFVFFAFFRLIFVSLQIFRLIFAYFTFVFASDFWCFTSK